MIKHGCGQVKTFGEKMKISIITITYNSEKTLKETISSIERQHDKELEYIVIDGGSTDQTVDIIKEHESIITKWISEPDDGISDAFNKGIQLASGEIIGIINSDDLLTDGAVENIKRLIKSETEVIFGNAIIFGGSEPDYRYVPEKNLDMLRRKMAVIHPATFIRKSAYMKYGLYNTQYKCQMDRELMLRMYLGGAKFQYIDCDLAKVRLGGINQQTYLERTLPEGTSISIKYGLKPSTAKRIAFKESIRYRATNMIRKLPFSYIIRKIFHAKNSILLE